MLNKKILLAGCHSCANRGDAAILRGIVDTITAIDANIQVDTLTRHPEAGRFTVANHHFIYDEMFDFYREPVVSLPKRVIRRFLPEILDLNAKTKGMLHWLLPASFQKTSQLASDYDLIVMVGGSYFVDYYGTSNYDIMQLAQAKGIPVVVLGHSIGPFSIERFNRITQSVLGRASSVILRERETETLMTEAGLTNINLQHSGDCAWLVEPVEVELASHIVEQIDAKTIAITARSLAPFDKRLGISQHEFELKFAQLINKLIAQGYKVLGVCTCTSLDGYHNDDRVVANRIKLLLDQPERFYVIEDELNDLEIGNILKRCVLTIGTRLHSAIISMRFGTPAYAIFYEHKSKGVLKQLDFETRSIWIHDVDNIDTYNNIMQTLSNIEQITEDCQTIVANEVKHTSHVACTTISNYLK